MYFLPNQYNLNTRIKSTLFELLYHEVFKETPVGPQYFFHTFRHRNKGKSEKRQCLLEAILHHRAHCGYRSFHCRLSLMKNILCNNSVCHISVNIRLVPGMIYGYTVYSLTILNRFFKLIPDVILLYAVTPAVPSTLSCSFNFRLHNMAYSENVCEYIRV